MDDFDKRWQRIHEQLIYQLHGDERPRVSSQRTLFGIKSEVETKMERFAAEIEEERRARVAEKRAREAASDNEDGPQRAPSDPIST